MYLPKRLYVYKNKRQSHVTHLLHIRQLISFVPAKYWIKNQQGAAKATMLAIN